VNSLPVDELRRRLSRYPADRYPIQHGTTCLYLGVGLAESGDPEQAERMLDAAIRNLDPDGLPAEHARARNARGAVRRQLARPAEAADDFVRAGELFADSGLPIEEGAAHYNLGLVRRELGDSDGAADSFRRATELLDADSVTAQAAAAARELGATQLTAGDLATAGDTLGIALGLAERAGDEVGLGATANVLGLAHLTAGRYAEAQLAFHRAVAANPRSIRPEAYAMAKANLALAYEQVGDRFKARLAASQAIALVPGGPVGTQALGVLERVGDGPGGLLEALADEPRERWSLLMREEAARWAEAPASRREAEAAALVEEHLAATTGNLDLVELWLGTLLELPPADMEALISATLRAITARDDEDRRRFHDQVGRAAARFHVPQMLRLEDTFRRFAAEMGVPWS
jgi:tetratricopeptide (TPR) repeat protein